MCLERLFAARDIHVRMKSTRTTRHASEQKVRIDAYMRSAQRRDVTKHARRVLDSSGRNST